MRSVVGWSRMMRQTISIAPMTGRDVYSKPVYSTSPTSVRCRLVGKRQMVRNDQNQDVVSHWTAYLMTDQSFGTDAQVTLSTGDVGSTADRDIHPPILSVGRYPANDGGYHHTVLYW